MKNTTVETLKKMEARGFTVHTFATKDEMRNFVLDTIGSGSAGFGGSVTCLGVFVEHAPTHIAGLPVAVNINCHVTRHKTAVL